MLLLGSVKTHTILHRSGDRCIAMDCSIRPQRQLGCLRSCRTANRNDGTPNCTRSLLCFRLKVISGSRKNKGCFTYICKSKCAKWKRYPARHVVACIKVDSCFYPTLSPV